MKETVYVYHEYNDNEAYGSQLMKVFRKEDNGKAYLAERVKKILGKTLDQLAKEAEEDDTIDDTYVSVNSGKGVDFFILNKLPVE